ncbi:MAG: hypothetical protein ACRDO4_08555 [Nocardioides sp.]
MQNTSARKTLVAVAATVVIGTGGLVGCGEATADRGAPVKSSDTLQMEAEVLYQKAQAYAKAQAQGYTGDPWEKRFREQFWSTQHIHDSWNRCHLGENVPPQLQSGPGC